MNFNLMSAMAAGTGALQGIDYQRQLDFQQKQQAQQNQASQMALMMNNLKLQDEQRNVGYANDESAYARQLATDPDTMDMPVDQKMDLMANKALSTGDLVRANELAVNATNFRSAKVMDDNRKALTASRVMESQQKLHNYMGSELAAAADSGDIDQFRQSVQTAIDSGQGNPTDRANLQTLLFTSPEDLPKLARTLRMGAMTANQQRQTIETEARQASIDENRKLMARDRQARLQISQERAQIAQEESERKAKAGGIAKAPTAQEMDQAASFLKDSGLKPGSAEFAQVQRSIIDLGKQWQRLNPNLTGAQALQKAADDISRTDIHMTSSPSKIPGMTPTKAVTYKMEGVSSVNPIPYSGKKDELIPGRYYKLGQGIYQFNGKEFVQAQ